MPEKRDYPIYPHDECLKKHGEKGSYRANVDMGFLRDISSNAKDGKDIDINIEYIPPWILIEILDCDKLDCNQGFREEEDKHEVELKSDIPKEESLAILKNDLKSPFIAGKSEVVVSCESQLYLQKANDVLDEYQEVSIGDQNYRLIRDLEVDIENRKIIFEVSTPEIVFEEAIEEIQERLVSMSLKLSSYFEESEMKYFRDSDESFEKILEEEDEAIDLIWMILTAKKKRELDHLVYTLMSLEGFSDEEVMYTSSKVINQLIAADKLERIGDRLVETGEVLDEIVDSGVELRELEPYLEEISDFIKKELLEFLEITCSFALGKLEDEKWRKKFYDTNEILDDLSDFSDQRFYKDFEGRELEHISGAYREMVKILRTVFRDAVAVFRWKVSV